MEETMITTEILAAAFFFKALHFTMLILKKNKLRAFFALENSKKKNLTTD